MAVKSIIILTKQVKKKYKAWKEHLLIGSEEGFRRYVFQRNRTTEMLRKAKRTYEENLAKSSKTQPKRLHRYIRKRLKVKAVVGPLEKGNGQLTENDKENAEILNDFFKSVFVKESEEELPDFSEEITFEEPLSTIPITPSAVFEELKRLKVDKAAGPDQIPSVVLKCCAEQLASPLATIFQKSLIKGQVPLDWKKATVTPIFKKGQKRKPNNYRPVSLTSQTCKVMERIVKKHIVQYLEENSLISPHQHGFVQKRSCQTNLLESLEEWTRLTEDKHGVDIIYLDYQKAFDSIPHRRLIHKLRGYGIVGEVLNWISDFLMDRVQQVSINGNTSEWGEVTSGVPQGSILGPVLFIIYVNELPSLVSSNIKMFADDMKLFAQVKDKSDAQTLQDDLDILSEWSCKWLLKFNVLLR